MPVQSYYYSEEEWNRLGCGLLPPERNRELAKSTSDGPEMDSTGRARGDGNTNGDGRNPRIKK